MRDRQATLKQAHRGADKPLQLAALRISRRSSKQLQIAAVPDDLSDDEAEVVLECTYYTQDEDSECGRSAGQNEHSDKEEEESDEEDEPASWPRMERTSSGGDDDAGWKSLSEHVHRRAERASRGERTSSTSTCTEIDAVLLFSPDSSIDGVPEGFSSPLRLDEYRTPLTWGSNANAPTATLDAVVSRRHVAAALLTGRGPRNDALAALPEEVALAILDEALPLLAALSCFSMAARVELHETRKAQTLSLQACELGLAEAEVVGWLLRHNPNLRSLDVSRNPLGPAGAACLGRALPHAAQLRELALNYTHLCGTSASGVDALSTGVAGHPSLRTLELGGNAIGANGGMGVRGLVSALSHPEGGLAVLKLGGNALGPAGTAAIASVLLERATLTNLDLSANQLTGVWGKCLDGVRALAMALACNSSLKELDLSANAIGAHLSESVNLWLHVPTSALLLARALTYNVALATLDLRANHIVGSQEEQLRAAWGGPLAWVGLERCEREGPLLV